MIEFWYCEETGDYQWVRDRPADGYRLYVPRLEYSPSQGPYDNPTYRVDVYKRIRIETPDKEGECSPTD